MSSLRTTPLWKPLEGRDGNDVSQIELFGNGGPQNPQR